VPKRDIRMSDAEIVAFLGGHAGCVIGYNDGRPVPAVRGCRTSLGQQTYIFYYSVNYSMETVAGAAHVGVLHRA